MRFVDFELTPQELDIVKAVTELKASKSNKDITDLFYEELRRAKKKKKQLIVEEVIKGDYVCIVDTDISYYIGVRGIILPKVGDYVRTIEIEAFKGVERLSLRAIKDNDVCVYASSIKDELNNWADETLFLHIKPIIEFKYKVNDIEFFVDIPFFDTLVEYYKKVGVGLGLFDFDETLEVLMKAYYGDFKGIPYQVERIVIMMNNYFEIQREAVYEWFGNKYSYIAIGYKDYYYFFDKKGQLCKTKNTKLKCVCYIPTYPQAEIAMEYIGIDKLDAKEVNSKICRKR